MLRIITSKKEIKFCQEELFHLLNKMMTGKSKLYIGSMGGGEEYLVTYSKNLGIWWYKGISDNRKRYWNAFGFGNSPETLTQDYFIEINYPIEGINKRVAAIWAQDEAGKIFLLHSGKMGGGKKGFTKEFFINHFKGTYTLVNLGDEIKEYVLIGSLQDELFSYQIAGYVKEVFRIKNIPEDYSTKSPTKVTSFDFTNEFFGKRNPYSLQHEVSPNCDHGLIVNELARLFKLKKIKFANDRRKDLFLLDYNGKHTHLFEIKSSLSLQNIYTAIGQLFLNCNKIKSKPALIFVCPEEIDEQLIIDLKALEISTITFSWKKGVPKFKNIEKIFNARYRNQTQN